MITKLTGTIDAIGLNHAVVDVNGVGYLVHASGRTLSRIGGTGAPASVLVDMHVREDAISLYGFCDSEERDWFRLLCTVQGVGAKAALSILSSAPIERLGLAIASEDRAAIQQADGVGPKLAMRIVTELKDKAAKMALSGPVAGNDLAGSDKKGGVRGGGASEKGVSSDAVSALINLGYGRSEAFAAVASVMRGLGDAARVGDVIRESLKELSA